MGIASVMQSWDLRRIETPGGSRSPVVLDSEEAARVVLIGLEPGQELGEHEVKEHAFVLVVEGTVQVEAGESLEAGEGMLLLFEPEERRTLSSRDGARMLLVLAPWPAPDHYRGGDERLATSGS
jgi:quercetin dioxygenase-like cupin family protein